MTEFPLPGGHAVLCIAGKEPIYKFVQLDDKTTLRLSKGCNVSLKNITQVPYGALLQVDPGQRQMIRLQDCRSLYEDVNVEETELNTRDNSNLVDDSTAQSMTQDEILAMKTSQSGGDIVHRLIAGSASFESKTALAQAKYIRKKRQKHCPFVTMQRPTPTLMCEVLGPKTMGMRSDTLAQMLAYGDVHANARVMCVDTVKGLLVASVLYRLGNTGDGMVIQVSPTNGDAGALNTVQKMGLATITAGKLKRIRFDTLKSLLSDDGQPMGEVQGTGPSSTAACSPGEEAEKVASKPSFWCTPTEARALLVNGADSLLVAAQMHPLDTVTRLWPFLAPSGCFSVFCPVLPPLQEVYEALRQGDHAVELKMCDNWVREYQVLPNRTHPFVNMNTGGGFLLSGIKVESDQPLAHAASAAPRTSVPQEAEHEIGETLTEEPPRKVPRVE